MTPFKIKIAGKTIEVKTIHTRTKALCRDFIVSDDEDPDISIAITQEEIDETKESYKPEIGHAIDYRDGSVEASVVLKKICEELIECGIFLFHGAAVDIDGAAYVFSGTSGVGKTTHARLWKRNIPGARIINGDKPFIMGGDVPKVCGSPWSGKERQYTNTTVPLKAIILLERGTHNKITQIPFSQAFIPLLEQTYYMEDGEKMRKTIRIIKSLEGLVTFWLFEVDNFAEDCFQTAYEALINK